MLVLTRIAHEFRTEKHLGTVPALATGALLFGGMHLANPGAGPLTWLSVSLLGVMWAGVFALTRNLWAVALNHASWNLTIFISGLPLSGQAAWREAAPLVTSMHGSVWTTGGDFGPEDAWLTIVLVAGACGWIIRRLARTGPADAGGQALGRARIRSGPRPVCAPGGPSRSPRAVCR